MIEVVENRDHTQEANTITITTASGNRLEIRGGFANCSQALSDGSHAIIDGAGGATGPVFRISVDTTGRVQFYNLTIQGGDTAGGGKGGGIYFTGRGDGTLQLDRCTVQQNAAGYGGGIYADGTNTDDSQGQLVIGQDVAIVGNTALFDGGGIVNDGTTLSMTQANSYIANNHAPNGNGGGLLVWAGRKPTIAYLGSTGLGNVGPIYLNDASRGGGIAVMGSDDAALLRLFSTDPTRPVRIKGNTASADGGGIYLGRAGDTYGQSSPIAGNAYIEDNLAPHGAAISVCESAGSSAGVFFNIEGTGFNGCPVGKPCGSFTGNAAVDNASQPTGGIVEASSDAIVRFHRMTFSGNTGKFVYFGNDRTNFDTYHVAITDNTVSGNVIAADGVSDYVDLENTTIVGNAIGTNVVLKLRSNASSPSKLYRSIVWQPLKTTLHLNGDPLDLLDDLVSEGNSVAGSTSPNLIVQYPRFVDPDHGDYSLRAGSPAVNYTTSVAADDLDLYSNPRDIDLPIVANVHGKRDLGAIERQALMLSNGNSWSRPATPAYIEVTAQDWTRTARLP